MLTCYSLFVREYVPSENRKGHCFPVQLTEWLSFRPALKHSRSLILHPSEPKTENMSTTVGLGEGKRIKGDSEVEAT